MDFLPSFWVYKGECSYIFLFSPLFSTLFFETLGLHQLCYKLSILSPTVEIMKSLLRTWHPPCLSQNLIRTCDLKDEGELSRWRVVSRRGTGGLGLVRNWIEARRGESLTKSPCGVQGQMTNKWSAFGVSLGVSQIREHVIFAITQCPLVRRALCLVSCSVLTIMLILLEQGNVCFHLALGFSNYVALSWLGVKSGSVTY